MRAITYSELGPAARVLTLRDLPTPDPAPGEVLVRLALSGANPSDVKSRMGRPGLTTPAFPLIVPHSDGAGQIVAVGDGVPGTRIGQQVWIWNGQWQRAFGTAAEYIALPAAQAVPLPDGVSLAAGACLGIPGLTAAEAVFRDGDVTGQTLLISGGAGAVGHNAVQLAAGGGARVIATCAPDAAARVRAAGAQEVLDYRDPDLAARVLDLTGGRGVDRAIETEFGVNAAMLAQVMRNGGIVAAYGSALNMTPELPFRAYLFKAITVEFLLIYITPMDLRARMIDRLHAALTSGALLPAIHARFPLDQTMQAHDCIEAGKRAGAVLITT